MKLRRTATALTGISAIILAGLADVSPAAAASGYTVTWSSASNYYAWGYTYTSTKGCTGTRKTLRIGGTTKATGVHYIKTPGGSSFVSTYSIPLHYYTVPQDKCWKVPESGSWTGFDPA